MADYYRRVLARIPPLAPTAANATLGASVFDALESCFEHLRYLRGASERPGYSNCEPHNAIDFGAGARSLFSVPKEGVAMEAKGAAHEAGAALRPLVSVTVPTLNSEEVIGGCLASVKAQSYPNIEILVIDSLSTDRTREIAANCEVTVITYEGLLLGARHQGLLHSHGEYVLLLDSDQVLEATTVERAVSIMGEYDMLVLEELSYQPKSWLQKLFCADRKLIHQYVDGRSLDPLEGTLLPRFFRREVLLRAFDAIPHELIPLVVHHDHAILYLEARKITPRVGILPTAVYHREPASLVTAWKRNFRYGRSLRELSPNGRYDELAQMRDRGFRKGSLRPENLGLGLQSFVLLVLLKTAQKAGYWCRELA